MCPYKSCHQNYDLQHDLEVHMQGHTEAERFPFPYAWNCPFGKCRERSLKKYYTFHKINEEGSSGSGSLGSVDSGGEIIVL